MAIKVGINGFGRIGRLVFRRMMEKGGFDIVAINDLTDPKTLTHLLKYDSVHGKYPGELKATETGFTLNGEAILITAEKDPTKLGWDKKGVDLVIESTGVFTTKEKLAMHLTAGAKKVILTAPPKDDLDAMIVIGVNDADIKPEHKIISNASCTTNCLAPMVKVLDENFGIIKGFMNTIHSYTNDQVMLDQPHKDLRRARAAAQNIIPTTTGAAKTLGKCIPEIAGKLDGLALRVPTPTVSITDFVCTVKNALGVEGINKLFLDAETGNLKGILATTKEPLVSMDFKGDSHSSIVDLSLTMVKDSLVKIISWYDNEWGYACRLAEMSEFVSK